MNQSAVYSGQYGYHYRQQPTYPAQLGLQPINPVQYGLQPINPVRPIYPAQYAPPPVYQVAYQQGYNYYYPAQGQNYANYYPSNYYYQNSAAQYYPACGTPVYVVYLGGQQGNRNNGLAAVVVATLVLVALDILFLRHK